ncbi:MAG TPA: hypothetical protein VFV89_10920 [Nocardioides sp.]|uniref:hypothetical protein n=1 Tax=Nocardioides sp. TaxID=35761 RepID=UPI002E302E19|nr:hypothetical protein [Nocardioides sp.]HEX5088310.1 hypothetical protein [Nocardioides sp.]
MGGFRAARLAATTATAFVVVGLAAPAYADTTVTVQGTDFPDPAHADLSFVGCDDLYQRTDEPLLPMIGLGPGDAPAGSRSLGWDLRGGNAIGAVFPVPSVLKTTTAGLEVHAEGPATGVAYAGYQPPSDAGSSLLWIGRDALATPGGAWQAMDATQRVYSWAQFDMTSGQQVKADPGLPATVADFAAIHGGDGPGFYTVGFGCDGTPFSMDRLEVGSAGSVTTYDLEGLRTSVTIAAGRVSGNGEVTVTGRLRTETGDPIPFATMILERREADSREWKQVQVANVNDGVARATVRTDGRTFYRWRFVERPLAEGSTSSAIVLDGLPTLQPDPSPPPTSAPPTGTPTIQPPPPPTSPPPTSQPPTDSPSAPGSGSPSASGPSPTEASSSPAGSPSTSPSGSSNGSASPSDAASTP